MSNNLPFFIVMAIIFYFAGFGSSFLLDIPSNESSINESSINESSINDNKQVTHYYYLYEKEAELFNKIQEEKLNLSIELTKCKSNLEFTNYLLKEAEK